MHSLRTVTLLYTCAAAVGLACSGNPPPGRTDGGPQGGGLASKYPGDIGIENDAAVVWVEDFEEGSVDAVLSRYDDSKNGPGMTLVADVPAGSPGGWSMRMTAGASVQATDLFKQLPDSDEFYVRWYVKYQPGVQWHHSGVWIGGYNPPLTYPFPHAGERPAGDDRFSVSVEPVFDIGGAAPRFDFYNYWMKMHSWMETPSGDSAYYGNALVHQSSFTVDEGQWVCLEVHVKLNTDPSSAAGAILEVWKNGTLVQRFDQSGPLGYWIRDKFCPQGADSTECTDYPAAADTVMDLQFRSTQDLHLNAFWPQNFITDGGQDGSILFDHMVVATQYVGCLQ